MGNVRFRTNLLMQAVCCWQQRHRQIMSLGTILPLAITPAVLSAERIEFFVGPFEPVIWVEDLEALAEDGTVNERLHAFASRLNEQQLQELRTFLNLRLDVDLITLSQFTYWQVGERFLDRMGQVVQTDSFLNGSLALRAALIAASVDGDGITSLEVMQAYPLDVIQLNFPLLQQIIQENRRFFADQDKVLAHFRAVGEAEATAFSSVIPDAVLPTRAGSYLWEQESLTFQNPLREGTIPFDIYLPQQTAESTPVIVFSHGVASGRNAFVYLAQHLASHGYAVVVPQHDDDSQKYSQFLAGVDRPPNPMTLISRPRDISLVLDV